MRHQKILDRSQFLHHGVHLILGGVSHLRADVVHLLLHLKEEGKGTLKHVADRHTFFQNGMLVQIADTDVFCPLNLSLIRHHLSGDDIHKCGLSLTVCSDETDMFPL